MDEQQIIGDILDRLYGNDSALKEEDSEIIKAKNKEKDEKSGEFMTQINNICKGLENELKSVIGPDISGIKKTIRFQVLTTIKAEIDNGNNVVDSNGKISVGKTFDIIRQSKSEILENIQNEIDTVNYKKEDGEIITEDSKEDKMLNNFFERLEEAGVELSQDEKDLMDEAVARVNEIMDMIKEKVDSGMSKAEALKSILSGMSRKEIELLRAQFILVGQCKLVDSFLENEKNGQKDSPETEKKDGKEDFPERNAKEQTLAYQEKSETNSNLPLPALDEYQEIFGIFDETIERRNGENSDGKENTTTNVNDATLGFSDQTLERLKQTEELSVKMLQIIRSGNRENDNLFEPRSQIQNHKGNFFEHIHSEDGRGGSDVKKEGCEEIYTTVPPETASESGAPKKGEVSPIAGTIIEQAKSYTTPLHEMMHATVDKKTNGNGVISKEESVIKDRKVSDKNFTPYFDERSEIFTVSLSKKELYTDISMLEKSKGLDDLYEMRDDDAEIIEGGPVSLTPPAPTSTMPPPPAPTSIVEEMTVDESGVTQEGQSEPSKKGTLSASALKALVESQAEVRKIFEANEIIHGQIPEKPTVEKSNTQGTPVADNDEKSGGEPEER